MKEYKKITLKNGLRILLVPQKGNLATTVLVLVEAGSEYETKDINGVSHFLEHMCFKGTITRSRPGEIAAELDALGSEYNAFTSQEFTGYWAKAQNHKLPQILDIVSDLYLNPTFQPDEIEKERGVVIEEINMYEDMPMRRIHDFFTTLLYGDQPAGWEIAGTKEIVRTLKRDDFVNYRTAHYIAPATLVVVAGDIDMKKTAYDITTRFGQLPKKPKVKKPKTTEHQVSPAVFLKTKESDQAHLVLGSRAFPAQDKRRFTLHVLADALGGGMSSRLFHRIREELGAAYYVRAGADLFIDHGYFAISAGVDHTRIELVIKTILEELERLKTTLMEPKELKKTKDHLIGGIVLGLEGSDELANYYGGQEIMSGSVMTPRQVIAEINKVTPEQIKAVASYLFEPKKLNLAVIGPYKNSTMFKKLLKVKVEK